MKYLFILGRNIELSVAEIKAFFRRDNFEFRQLGLIDNGLLVETNRALPKNSIDRLGGVISIGEVLASGTGKKIFDELDKKTIYFSDGNKLNFVLYDFSGKDFADVLFYLKQKFKKEGLKATEKRLSGNIKMQSGEFVPNVLSKSIDEQYFVFEENFGRVIEKNDYKKIGERDMKKPVRRNELSISPRLAKILINLSEVKEGETLLDPFCGIGVVLEESLLQKINAVGIDKDKNAILDAGKNLRWFGFDDKNYRLINGDSSKIKIPKLGAVATEPALGKLQKGNPSNEEARKITKYFEELMIKVLKNLKNYVDEKIAFTAPLVFTKEEMVSCDFKKIGSSAGLKILEGPIHEFREDSIIGRDVIVMGK